MNIDSVIKKLNEFKKISKSFKGKCELVDFNDSSFTIKVDFNDNANEQRHVIGFNASAT